MQPVCVHSSPIEENRAVRERMVARVQGTGAEALADMNAPGLDNGR